MYMLTESCFLRRGMSTDTKRYPGRANKGQQELELESY